MISVHTAAAPRSSRGRRCRADRGAARHVVSRRSLVAPVGLDRDHGALGEHRLGAQAQRAAECSGVDQAHRARDLGDDLAARGEVAAGERDRQVLAGLAALGERFDRGLPARRRSAWLVPGWSEAARAAA